MLEDQVEHGLKPNTRQYFPTYICTSNSANQRYFSPPDNLHQPDYRLQELNAKVATTKLPQLWQLSQDSRIPYAADQL